MLTSVFPAPVVEAAGDLAIILGVIIAGVTVFKFPYKRFVSWLRGNQARHDKANQLIFETIPALTEGQCEIRDQLKFIVSELKTNGGESLRDKVVATYEGMLYNRTMFRALLSQDAKPLFITDENANLVWTNTAFNDLVNRDSQELMGQGYWGVVNPPELDVVRTQQRAARADKRDMVIYFNVTTGDPDFPLIPVELTAVPNINARGEVAGYLGSLKRLDGHYEPKRKDDDGTHSA